MFFRMLFGLPGAAFITGFLFVAMAWMIRQEAIIDPPVAVPTFDILPKITETTPTPKPPGIQKIDDPEPPKIKFPTPATNPGPTIPTILPANPGSDGGIMQFPELLKPTVKIAPPYPENCKARGAQGVVVVEFDVTAEGDVVNPRIISSANSCLERTVLNTIVKWKYSPRQDSGGRPIPQRGLREYFNFQLTE